MDKDTISIAVNPDLLAEAQSQGLDLEELFEHALLRTLSTPTATRMRNERAEAWRKENAEAVQAWNEEVRRNGLWCDKRRQF